jgi:hypothetical protein
MPTWKRRRSPDFLIFARSDRNSFLLPAGFQLENSAQYRFAPWARTRIVQFDAPLHSALPYLSMPRISE